MSYWINPLTLGDLGGSDFLGEYSQPNQADLNAMQTTGIMKPVYSVRCALDADPFRECP
jgi:hypothetical protein